MQTSRTNQVRNGGLFSLCAESQLSNNKANQPDTFFVRDAHKKRSGYLQRYMAKE